MPSLTRRPRPGVEQIFDLAEDVAGCQAATASLIGSVPLSRRLRQWLRRRYADPALPYHGAAHVGLLWLRHLAHDGAPDDAAMALAILFHDAVYQPMARDNEVRSAALLRRAAGPGEEADWAASAVLATADHLAYSGDDARLLRFLDLDLSPLAERPPVFERNTAALRREAASMGDADWAAAQRRLLAGFLARPPLFRSGLAVFYEAPARRNIGDLVQELDDAKP